MMTPQEIDQHANNLVRAIHPAVIERAAVLIRNINVRASSTPLPKERPAGEPLGVPTSGSGPCKTGRCPPRRPSTINPEHIEKVRQEIEGMGACSPSTASFSQKMAPAEEMATFSSGAKRAEMMSQHARYDCMNEVALRRYAETCGEGCCSYGPDNWKQGFPAEEMIAHHNVHMAQYLAGDASEDHLAHAMWNLASLMWYEENRPEVFANMPCRHLNGGGLKPYTPWWETPKGRQRLADKLARENLTAPVFGVGGQPCGTGSKHDYIPPID